MNNYFKKGIIVLFCIAFCISVFFGCKIVERESSNEESIDLGIIDEDKDSEVIGENVDPKIYIKVDIAGAVKNSGVYTLEEKSRLDDAIVKAGGLSDAADMDMIEKYINRAKIIHDGEKIYIPFIGDDSGIFEHNSSDTGLININVADKKSLMSLTGIGESYAERIIEYRRANRFENISEIKKVKGIGDSLFEKIKNFITVN